MHRKAPIAKAAITLVLAGALPLTAAAQGLSRTGFGPVAGDREFSIAGTGSSDRDFDSSSAGVSGDLGWYLRNELVIGVRQSINYADIQGENVQDDFWNGSTRGYVDYQFLEARTRPFVGASLGAVYGDGIKDSAFSGLELGVKHYVLEKTYLLGRMEYQWFFSDSSDADDAFDDGAWAYTLGMGFNF